MWKWINKIGSLILFSYQLSAQDTGFADIHKPLQQTHHQFSLQLFKTAYQPNQNCLLCPFAVETMLQALYLGSHKVTAYEFKQVLKSTSLKEELIDRYAQIHLSFTDGLSKGEVTLKHGLWISHEIKPSHEFLQMLHKMGSFEIENDELNKTKSTAKKIEEWIAGRSKRKHFGTLKDLGIELTGKIAPVTLVDVNLNWASPFDPLLTSLDPFHFPHFTESQGLVEMMQQTLETDFYEDDQIQVIKLALDHHLSLVILLPKNDPLEKIVDHLGKPIYLKKLLSKLKTTVVDVKLPKISIDSTLKLNSTLMKMGIKQAFLKLADFSTIDPKHSLFVGDYIQFSRFYLNESGINLDNIGKLKKPLPLKPEATCLINHPFIFCLVDTREVTLLQMGCYQSPF
jgi:serpin B